MILAIGYVPVDFPAPFGPRLSKSSVLYCSWSDIVRSAITVGRENWLHVVQYQKYSYFEIVYRAALMYANLKAEVDYSLSLTAPKNCLIQSSAYENLDPSEKSAISYFLGLTTSKLFAENLLGVPWLMHLDVYKDKFDIKTLADYRPDLVGIDRDNRWVVIEAKGRSNALDKRVMSGAKRQALSLSKIAGKRPFLYVALASYFSSNNSALKIYAKDPPIDDMGNERSFELDISLPDYLITYYSPLVEFIQSGYQGLETITTFQNRRYLVKRIDEADLWFGLDEQIYQLLLLISERQELMTELLVLFNEISRFMLYESLERPDREISVGLDGTYVRLGNSWNDERMFLEPKDRTSL